MPNRAVQGEQRRPRRRGITREAIVDAAIALADGEGLEAVSIRHVAAALGARPMSLYTYIATKQDLFQLMADAVVAEVIVPDRLPSEWREALRAIAARSYHTLLAHPWLVAVAGRRRDLGANALRHAEQLLTAVAPLGLEPHDAWQVVSTLNDYLLGHALRVAHTPARSPESFPAFDAAAYPRLHAALATQQPVRDEATFHAGLEMLLDGIEHRVRDVDPARGATMP